MKTFNILLVFFVLNSFGSYSLLRAQEKDPTTSNASWQQYGDEFNTTELLSDEDALKAYEKLGVADTVGLKFSAKVESVCKVKGCWMVVKLTDGHSARITFKDYGFFVPLDVEGKEVLLSGEATVGEMDEQTRRHYASDEGLSEEEISKISGSEKTFSMVASGVMIRD